MSSEQVLIPFTSKLPNHKLVCDGDLPESDVSASQFDLTKVKDTVKNFLILGVFTTKRSPLGSVTA